MSEHREKAVAAIAKSRHERNLMHTGERPWGTPHCQAGDDLQAAEPHLQRMYWERFGEAVLSGKKISGDLSFLDLVFGAEFGHEDIEALRDALKKAQDLMEGEDRG